MQELQLPQVEFQQQKGQQQQQHQLQQVESAERRFDLNKNVKTSYGMGGFGGSAIPVIKRSTPIESQKNSNRSTVCNGFHFVRRHIAKTRNSKVLPMCPTTFIISKGSTFEELQGGENDIQDGPKRQRQQQGSKTSHNFF